MTRVAMALCCVALLSACFGEPPRDLHGTAARRDALSSGVVISEVYGGGNSTGAVYRYDFVELFNRGTSGVDVTGWSVQYAGAMSGAWQVTTLADAGVMAPGQYLLVRMGTQGAQGAALPPHDFAGASLMSNTAGKVALVAGSVALTTSCPPSSSWVDLVGYGAAGCFEGTPTPTPAVDSSAQRRLEGCRETDDNLADFVLGPPTPMSSAATPVDCATVTEPDAGCRVLTTWPTTSTKGAYVAADGLTWSELREDNPDGGDGNMLSVELYWPAGGLTLPYSESFTTGSTYAACQACAWIGEGCDPQLGCTKFYFQQSGSVTVSVADQDEAAGNMAGALTDATFVEWDFGQDQAVAGGGCIQLGPQSFATSWGGAGGGAGTGGGGAGTGGGGATGGGGGATGGGGGATGGGGGSTGGGGGATGGGGGDATDGGSSASGGGGGSPAPARGCGCTAVDAFDSAWALFALLAWATRRALTPSSAETSPSGRRPR